MIDSEARIVNIHFAGYVTESSTYVRACHIKISCSIFYNKFYIYSVDVDPNIIFKMTKY